MKLKKTKHVLKVIVPTLAVGVLATAGYATWTFAKGANLEQKGSVSVVKYEEQGVISTEKEAIVLTLDQGSTSTSTDGIIFTWGDSNFDFYIGTANDKENKTGDLGEDALTITRTYTLTLDDTLAKYIKFSGVTAGKTDTTATKVNDKQISGNWVDRIAFDCVPAFVWIDKPTNKTEYQAMIKDLKSDAVGSTSEAVSVGEHLTLALSVAVSDKATA